VEVLRDDRIKCWETYLRNEKELLRDHKGEYVAIYNGKIAGISQSDVELAKMIHDMYGDVEAFIYKIEEEDEEPIQMPPYVGNIVEL
jgi:Tfp pilus assembly protein PilP